MISVPLFTMSLQDEVIKKIFFLIQKDKIHMKLETAGFNDAKCSLKKFGESMINVSLSGKENYIILKWYQNVTVTWLSDYALWFL